MNRFFTGLFLISMAVCSFVSCSQPVGSIQDSGNSGGNNNSNLDDFFIQVFKDEFYLNRTQEERSFFRRSDYFRVVGFSGTGRIDPNDYNLKIEIMTSPISLSGDIHKVINPYGSFEFSVPGSYLLKGTYNGKSDEWPIEVYGSEVNTGGGSSTIGMEWLP